MGACLLGVTVGLGWVPATASPATVTEPTLVAPDACPVTWPALRPGPPGDRFDGQVSVLVGGSLRVTGAAAGAEGIVVARGDATFARDTPGPYRVGVTDTGSQVPPHPGSDMLVVGGNLTADPGTPVEVGPALDGDAAVQGVLAPGSVVSLGGGTLDEQVTGALAPYEGLLADLGPKSGAYAARPVTGSVEVSESAITLTGDGASDPQVFAVEGAALGVTGAGAGRTLQVVGVPPGAAVVVNLTGPVVELDVDGLLGPGGAAVDPVIDPYFAELATHLLWNVPAASTVDIGGAAQLPGSLLVGAAPSTTTLTGAGTNGRVLVAGDLVHAGAGELHAYPFLRDPDLTCGPDLEHLGTLTLDVVLKDPGKVVDPERYFEGTYSCFLDGEVVTPGEGTWQLRAQADDRVLSDRVPVGAQCFVDEQLKVAPAPGWDWAEPDIAPARVKVAKRDPRGFTVTNSVQPVKTPPVIDDDPPPTAEPTPDTIPEPPPEPPPTVPPDPASPEPTEPTPALPELDPLAPTDEPDRDPLETPPSLVPAPEVTNPSLDKPQDGPVVAAAEPPARPDTPGPLTTTAPYTLRGAFVWAPLLLLSVLALRLRFPWRYKRRRRPLHR
jgi:choice-of-anchor A domain-containing protein